MPEPVSVEDVDLCVLLGNLLDNALEACDRIPPGQRFHKALTDKYEEQYANLNETVRKRETELATAKAMPFISDMTEPEKSLNGQSRAEIEEMVLCYAQARIDGTGHATNE